MEDIEKNIAKNVKRFGFDVLHFEQEPDFPGYAHTVGLYENNNHPELVMFGLPEETMHILLSNASDRVKGGGVIEVGKVYEDFFEDYPLQFVHVNVDEYKGLFGPGIDFYDGHEFPALQLVWPDQKKNFPWDEKYDEKLVALQPLLM